jgi:hypothetical protein
MNFNQTHEDGSMVNYVVPEGADLNEVLDSFMDFLRGCGYVIPYTSCLTIVDKDDNVDDDHMDHWGQDVEFD